MEFKLVPSFPDLDAQDARSVMASTTPWWSVPPTFCPTNDQGPTAADGDQALDLLLLS
jgi:hypothetical protein